MDNKELEAMLGTLKLDPQVEIPEEHLCEPITEANAHELKEHPGHKLPMIGIECEPGEMVTLTCE